LSAIRDFESEYTLVGYRRQQNSVLGCFYSAVGCVNALDLALTQG
jgi:hypothetical protein